MIINCKVIGNLIGFTNYSNEMVKFGVGVTLTQNQFFNLFRYDQLKVVFSDLFHLNLGKA